MFDKSLRILGMALLACLVAPVRAQSGSEPDAKRKAGDELNAGVAALTNAQYPEATEHFKAAVQLDPDYIKARLYLATAYIQQYIPGADTPENLEMARAAQDQFQNVLDLDPSNELAIASIASLLFQQKKLDDAQEWNRKLIAVNPTNKEAYYTLAVIAWTKTFPARMEARTRMAMRPEDPGPLRDAQLRAELAAKSRPIIEDGIRNLQEALSLDPQYDDGMAYMNLLYREKADLEDTVEDYKAYTAEADRWVQKSLDTRKAKAARN